MKKILYLMTALVVVTLAACDNVDDSRPQPLYNQEFLDIHVKDSFVMKMVNDNDSSLNFPKGLKVNKALHHPDTIYRYVMLYSHTPGEPITIYSDAPVFVKKPAAVEDAKTTKLQPLNFVSAWKANNCKYVNLVLGVMTGQSDKKQTLDLVEDSTVVNTDGLTHHYVSLRHDQNGVPEMFTDDLFVSVPLSQYNADDSVTVSVPTYNGLVKKSYKVGK